MHRIKLKYFHVDKITITTSPSLTNCLEQLPPLNFLSSSSSSSSSSSPPLPSSSSSSLLGRNHGFHWVFHDRSGCPGPQPTRSNRDSERVAGRDPSRPRSREASGLHAVRGGRTLLHWVPAAVLPRGSGLLRRGGQRRDEGGPRRGSVDGGGLRRKRLGTLPDWQAAPTKPLHHGPKGYRKGGPGG